MSYMGTGVLNKFAEYQEGYKDTGTDATKQATFKAEQFEAWMAYLVIRGCDQSKYGSLTRNFVSQYSLGNDQYPKTIQGAIDVLSNHRFDPKFAENKSGSRICRNSRKPRQMLQEWQASRKRIRTRESKSHVTYVVRLGIGAHNVLKRMIFQRTNGLSIRHWAQCS